MTDLGLMIIRNRTTKTLEASPLNNRNHPNAAAQLPRKNKTGLYRSSVLQLYGSNATI